MTSSSLSSPALRHDPTVPPVGQGDPLESLADADLLAQVAEGDVEAFSVLYRRHESLLLTMAARILGNLYDAEEALQDAFLHAWRKADQYEASRSSVLTWLVLITRSRSLDRLRSQQLARKKRAEYGREGAIVVHPSALVNRVLNRERGERMVAAMEQLPAAQRRVVELCYYRGLSQQEVAKHTGTPLGTVKTRHLLAMKKLRSELAEEIRHLI